MSYVHASRRGPVEVVPLTPMQEINLKRPRRRARWPLRGGRRLRYNQSPFFAIPTQPRRLPFATDKEAMRFARWQMYRAGWDAVVRAVLG